MSDQWIKQKGSDETEPEVVAAVGTGRVVLYPPLDALRVEAVLAPRQQNAAVVPLELHQADRTSPAHLRVPLTHLREGLMQGHYLVSLSVLQILTGRKEGLRHEPVDLPASIGKDEQEQEQDEEYVGSEDDLQVVLADLVKRGAIVGGVELLEQFGEEEEGAEDDGELVVAVLLETHQPPPSDDDVLEADHVDGRGGQVHHILADAVLVPVRDGEDEEGQRHQRLHDARNVLLDHTHPIYMIIGGKQGEYLVYLKGDM